MGDDVMAVVFVTKPSANCVAQLQPTAAYQISRRAAIHHGTDDVFAAHFCKTALVAADDACRADIEVLCGSAGQEYEPPSRDPAIPTAHWVMYVEQT